MDAKDIAGLLLDGGAVEFNVENPFTYTSGIKSPIYTDCRKLISDVEKREKIVALMCEKVSETGAELIAATASAAVPWGSWVAWELELPMVYVRGKAKEHGKKNQVEGNPKKGAKTIVVEDLVSTGISSISSVEVLRELGLVVEEVVCIFTYSLDAAVEGFEKAGVKLHSLSSFDVAAKAAGDRGYLAEDEIIQAKQWQKDPQRWKE